MSAWQPIETAPKDGTVVLLCYWEEKGFQDAYPIISGYWSRLSDGWCCEIPDTRLSPSHWMPAPKPPGGAERQEAVRCFMDGIDWEYHLANDAKGTLLFPTERSLRAEKTCLSGGCGVVEVEVSLIRWVEPQDLKFEEGRP